MQLPEEPAYRPSASRAPASAVKMMIVILAVFGLVAAFTGVQKLRRDRVETVTVLPAASPSPSPVPR